MGLACITKVLPVPVCDATDVAFPEEVIGPVKLAFVVTVPAFPLAFPVTFPVSGPEKAVAESVPVPLT